MAEIADVWTCCAAVAMRTERMVFGPMVTPLARRRPQVLARQAASLALLSEERFVLGLGLGDDWVGEFSDFGDEPDPKARARLLDESLDVLTGLLSGGFGPPREFRSGWRAGSRTRRPCAGRRGTTASS